MFSILAPITNSDVAHFWGDWNQSAKLSEINPPSSEKIIKEAIDPRSCFN